MNNNKQTLQAIFHSVGLCFLLLVTLPATAYYFNQTDLSLHNFSTLKIFLYSALPVIIITGLIARYLPRVWSFIHFFILGFFLYFFIRNFLWPIPFDLLDGRIFVTPSLLSDSSFWTSLGLLSACFLFTYFAKNTVKFIVLLGILISIGWGCFVFLSYYHNNANLIKDTVKFNQFSTKKNILVISFDGLQNNFLQETLKENPELKKIFDGFTFYTNTTSYGPSTIFSLLSTITSHYLATNNQGTDISSLHEHYKSFSILANLSQQNFQTDGYNISKAEGCKAPAVCLTYETLLSKYHISSPIFQPYDIALLRVLPKSISWPLMKQLSLVTQKPNKFHNQDIIQMQNDKVAPGIGLERFIFHHLYQNPTLTSKPVFKFHHYLFTHLPIRFDKQCHYNTNLPENADAAKNEMVCALHEFDHFLTKLKNLNIYDNSLIIFASDHGYGYQAADQVSATEKNDYLASFSNQFPDYSASRYWPILLIKLPESRGEMRINQKPVALVDIAPTLYEFTHQQQYCASSQCDGISLINTDKIPENRIRKAMIYTGGIYTKGIHGDINTDSRLYETVNINGNARKGVFEAMLQLVKNSTQPITCGKTIFFNQYNPDTPEFIIIKGLYGVEPGGRWSKGKKTSLSFKFNSTDCPQHTIRLKLYAYFDAEHLEQTANVFLNAQFIGKISLYADKAIPNDLVLHYEPSMINQNGLNTLQFNIPHPAYPPNDPRLIGLSFQQITFE